MTNHVLLNNVDHKDLRIITARSAALGDNVMCAATFHQEFRNVQAHYPIFFRKEPGTSGFRPVAMFGFEEQENLFLKSDGWDATYIPLTIERQPFLIGFQQLRGDGGISRPVIHVNMDSPRISQTEGELVFLQHGGLSEYLERINSILHTIHNGFECDRAFVQALLELDLLESFALDVELDNGVQHRLVGFYTINEERLNELGGDALAALNSKGFLAPVYMAIASLSNIRALIERKTARLQLQSGRTDRAISGR
ncbi:MAG: SapC family protein [Woeseia sp.]